MFVPAADEGGGSIRAGEGEEEVGPGDDAACAAPVSSRNGGTAIKR